MNDQLKVNVQAENGALNVRHGELPEIVVPVKKVINGDINAVTNFILHEVGEYEINTSKSHLEIDRYGLKAVLFVDANEPIATMVTSTLVLNPDLKDFGINGEKIFSRESLSNFLRQKRYLFPDKDAHAMLIKSVKDLHLKIQTEIQQSSDTRGNAANNFTKNVQSEAIPLITKIKLPLFKNQNEVETLLDICFDTAENSVRFWFESAELDELIASEIERLFGYIAETASAKGILVINK